MIISKTPLRISLFGGGTDLPGFYSQYSGSVLSFAINRYVYITLNNKFEQGYRVAYSTTENVTTASQIKHPLVRNSLKLLKVEASLEITSIAEVPSSGSGLGSSSSFTVGLLNALHANNGESVSSQELAEQACTVEISLSGEPIGKQDQFAASYGGINFINFEKNGQVNVEQIEISEKNEQNLFKSLILFYTGVTRSASKILSMQSQAMQTKQETIRNLLLAKEQSVEGMKFLKASKFDEIGALLGEAWIVKKKFHPAISTDQIDLYYAKALEIGALGGKLLGAGGGGFMLLYANPMLHSKLISNLPNWRHIPIALDKIGSQILVKTD
jgi:D-glycero-alpha-D-manno-heptose-7-phosphate kinase